MPTEDVRTHKRFDDVARAGSHRRGVSTLQKAAAIISLAVLRRTGQRTRRSAAASAAQ